MSSFIYWALSICYRSSSRSSRTGVVRHNGDPLGKPGDRESCRLTEGWGHNTRCGRWDVEEVVAHLTAAVIPLRIIDFHWLPVSLHAVFRYNSYP
jgi:hypothetical protein